MNGPPCGISPGEIERIESDSFVRRVEFHRELPSTNDLALERATLEDIDAPLLVLAERQIAGRGRGANQWWSAPGALTFSLVIDRIDFELDGASDSRLSLTTALAVHDALRECVPLSDVQVKWPNDVYLQSRKVAGILLERSSIVPDRIVVGVGVNVNNSLSAAPDEIRARATSLCDSSGGFHPLFEILRTILRRLEVRYRKLATEDPRLAEEWREFCFLRGRVVQVESGNRLIEGVCLGVDEQGALMVQSEAGLQRLVSGVVLRVEGSSAAARSE